MHDTETVARAVGASQPTVYRWKRRYEEGGCPAVLGGPRVGAGTGSGKAAPMEGAEHAYDGFEGALEEKVRRLEIENAILREANEL